jgi:hypothetical protein
MPRGGGQSGRNIKCCYRDPRCPGQGDRPTKGFWLAMIVRADVKASPVAEWLGADFDRAGRVKVEGNLSVSGHPNIFVIGDAAAATGSDGKPLPGVAPVAKQQGWYVAYLLAARAQGRTLPAFRYRDFGSMPRSVASGQSHRSERSRLRGSWHGCCGASPTSIS